jgi:hypothetical protein
LYRYPTDEPARNVDGEWVLVYANVEARGCSLNQVDP